MSNGVLLERQNKAIIIIIIITAESITTSSQKFYHAAEMGDGDFCATITLVPCKQKHNQKNEEAGNLQQKELR